MQTILGIIIFSIIVCSFVKLKFGIAIYLVYFFLVPYLNIDIGKINLSYNFVNLLILIAFVIDFKIRHKYKIEWSLFKPFFLYFFLFILVIPFQSGLPYSFALNQWRIELMSYLILPIIIWNIIKYDYKAIPLFRNTLIACIIIMGAYGLFLTRTEGVNPYMIFMSIVNNVEFNEDYAMSGGGRLFGRISSVFSHPMTFALNLGFSFIYIYILKWNLKKWNWLLILILVGLNIFTCGVRSVIAGVAIAIAYFLYANRNLKLLSISLFIGVLVYLIISSIPDLASYVYSIVDVNASKSDVGGSSLEMRLRQLDGCFDEISNCLLFGKGYGWTIYYMSLYDDHPIILAFESLIYVILCNAGIWGFIVWGIFLYKWYYTVCSHVYYKREVIIPICLILFYITYSCITGEYGYMKYFLIYYVMIMGEITYNRVLIKIK